MARPPIWEDAEAFDAKVEEYFNNKEAGPHTWTGLARYLGFESRQSLEDYKEKQGFSYPIKKALLRIEEIYEQNLFAKNAAGPIFALKNFGWRDKLEVDQKSTIKDERIDPTSLTEDELRILAEIQRKSRTSQKEGS